MTKISPIAAYLTANKAITKRNNNVWHFFSKEGLYLGRQIKMDFSGATLYLRDIYGQGFKRLFSESILLAQKCAYFVDKESLLGINIAVTETNIQKNFVDFIKNQFISKRTDSKLKNPMQAVAIDENTGIGIFKINKPFKYESHTNSIQTGEIKKRNKIIHIIN